jgi:peptidoglycan/LPS O-acetylase OafA/YrhL
MAEPTRSAARRFTAEGYEAGAPRRDFRRDIQGLRALAVILVIGNHAGLPGFGGGYVGVDVFFVISGYVITQLLLREASKGMRLGLADFYSRRVRRIVPAATATLVGTLVVSEVALGARLDPNLPGDVRWASLFAANFRLIATGSNYFVPGVHPSLITPFWSLAVEEQFYLAFPVIVFLIARYVAPERRLGVLSLTLGTGIAASAWWSVQVSSGEPSLAYYSPLTRFWELGLGCLLATLTTRRPSRTVRSERLAAGAGLVLLVVALVTLSSASTYPGSLAWLPCGATALFVWAGLGGVRTPVTRLLSTRPLGYIGDISYSLYLAHYLWLELPQQLASPLTGPGWRLLELGGTVVTAMCSYHLLEGPVRRSRLLAADHVAVLLGLCVCIAVSWTAAGIVGGLAPVA